MFNIVTQESTLVKSSISVCKGKINLYLPAKYVDKRADIKIKDDIIIVNFKSDGERKFTSVSKTDYCGVPGLLYKNDNTLYAKKLNIAASINNDIITINIPKLDYFYKNTKEKERSFIEIASEFYSTIEKLNLEPFIHEGKVVFKYKN